MPNTRAPRRGSMQFWPRKRAKNVLPRRGSYPESNDAKFLSFPGYKVGMCHCLITDNKKTSPTKQQIISIPITIIDTPPIKILSARFYKTNPETNFLEVHSEIILANDKNLARKVRIPKGVEPETLDKVNLEEINDVRALCFTQPSLTSRPNKKPEIFETALGGSKEDKLKFIKEHAGKDIKISEIFQPGEQLDVTGVTKGKGFQGTVKRYGVAILSHKAEKMKRGIANLGAWSPTHVQHTVPQPGKMGYHTRTEYNKWFIKVSDEDINPAGGFEHYGLLKGDYILLKGSVSGPSKRVLRLTKASRPNVSTPKEAPEVEKLVL